MDTIKAPQESIDAYLYNEFNIEIYEDLTENKDWQGLFAPLEFFNFLYSEFEFFYTNARRYLDIKTHFGALQLGEGKELYYFLWALNCLVNDSFSANEDAEYKSCEFIEKKFKVIEKRLFQLEENDYANKDDYGYGRIKDCKYDFEKVKQHLETLPGTKEKIRYLIEVKTEYEQQDDGFVFDFNPTFDKQCELEIEKLKDLMALEPKPDDLQPAPANNGPAQRFKLAGKRGAKTDLIRVLNALYELRYIETPEGQIPNKADFMKQAGAFFGVDLSKYDTDLSQALNSASLEANLKVFEEMKGITQNSHYLGREQQ